MDDRLPSAMDYAARMERMISEHPEIEQPAINLDVIRMAKEIERLKELLGYSEQFRDHYRKGKLEMYAMGGEIANAAMSHLPCSEGPLERAARKLIHGDCESKRYCEKLKSKIQTMKETLQRTHIAAITQLEDLEDSHKDRPRDGDADMRVSLETIINDCAQALE